MLNYINFTKISEEERKQIYKPTFYRVYCASTQKRAQSALQGADIATPQIEQISLKERAKIWEILAQFLQDWEDIRSKGAHSGTTAQEFTWASNSDNTSKNDQLTERNSTWLHSEIVKIGKLPHQIKTGDLIVLGQYAYWTDQYMQKVMALLQNPELTAQDRTNVMRLVKDQVTEIADEGTITNVINIIHALGTNLEKAEAQTLVERQKKKQEELNKKRQEEQNGEDTTTTSWKENFQYFEGLAAEIDDANETSTMWIKKTQEITLPTLYDFIDLEHTEIMIAAILVQCQESPTHKNVNNVIESLYPKYPIGKILETAEWLLNHRNGMKSDDFVYLIAHELVRAALKHGPALSGTPFADDIADKNLDDRDYENDNYEGYALDYREIDKPAEDINITRVFYHQGIEDVNQDRKYERGRFSEGMEKQIIHIMEQTWEYDYSDISDTHLDHLNPEDRLIGILQDIQDYNPETCKSILEKLSSYDGNIQLTKIARPFREVIVSFVEKNSPAAIKDNFDNHVNVWGSHFTGNRIEYKTDISWGATKQSQTSEIRWDDINEI